MKIKINTYNVKINVIILFVVGMFFSIILMMVNGQETYNHPIIFVTLMLAYVIFIIKHPMVNLNIEPIVIEFVGNTDISKTEKNGNDTRRNQDILSNQI